MGVLGSVGHQTVGVVARRQVPQVATAPTPSQQFAHFTATITTIPDRDIVILDTIVKTEAKNYAMNNSKIIQKSLEELKNSLKSHSAVTSAMYTYEANECLDCVNRSMRGSPACRELL